jgi:G:T/U-mismatch repair DNA glycosylase
MHTAKPITPVEYHPFEPFVPPNARFLLIGTFPGWQLTQKVVTDLAPDDWYYGTNSRSLWHLLEQVYNLSLPTKTAKQALLTQLQLGITDVVATARRKGQDSQDSHLYDLTFQTEKLAQFLQSHQFEALFFTSKQAQKWYNGLSLILQEVYQVSLQKLLIQQQVLPSPSPEYIRFKHDTVEGRLAAYRQLLPGRR